MRRPAPPREIPPPLELECLKAMWTLGEGNVKEVRDALAPARPLAYTTVMTLLDRLARKGVLTRRKVSRSFVYTPAVTRDSLRRAAVRELLANFFDGSEQALIAHLTAAPPPEAEAASPAEPAARDDRLDTVLL
ncbi:MAG: BlaI/MecI/CopY family transcriptional regulator [Acidobacteria bacterium]|nr:BlaI/MecI/CopY family transcriptional regulator [Acidobacteriota bacterium]